jgi:hypothetical protein
MFIDILSKMSNSKLQPVAEVLMTLLEKGKSPISQSYQMSKIWAYWNDWLPSSISKGTQPIALDRGTLYILVKNSAWMYELNFNRELILKKILNHMDESVVQNIKFTLDPKTLPQEVLERAEFKEFLLKSHFKSQEEGDSYA